MRRLAKRSCQVALASYMRGRCRFPGSSLVILTYHRVLPAGHPDLPIMQPGMVVTPESFRTHIRWLRQYFDIVKLGEWVRGIGQGQGFEQPRKACAITFDDGWRDTFQFAFPILEHEQVPATIFLVSDMVGTANSFWPERLARLLWNNGAGLSREVRLSPEHSWLRGLGLSELPDGEAPDRNFLDRVIQRAKRYSDDFLNEQIGLLEESAHMKPPPQPDVLDWDQVRTTVRSGLIDIGSHGRTHTRLNEGMASERIENEIRGSKELIEQKTGCRVHLFCYPNGDVTPLSEQLVGEHYLAACTTSRGWNSREADRYRLKRISIHEDATHDRTPFLAKLSGFL